MNHTGSGGTTSNLLRISGVMIERDALRHTPARIPVLRFTLRHESVQIELDVERKVACEVEALAMGPLAQQLAAMPLGLAMEVEGFLVARSVKVPRPVLHVRKLELPGSSL